MKTTIVLALLVVLMVGGYLTFVHYQMRDDVDLTTPPNGAITMIGTTTCLPHRDTEGPQTLECAFGLYGEDENYYAIVDTQETGGLGTLGTIPSDSRVEIQGTFTREEDTKYASVGTIEVTSVAILDGTDITLPRDTVSDEILTFTRPVGFGLATTPNQILVKSVIPPCEPGFLYCFYFIEDTYVNTNFESAGISIRPRSDLETETACLETSPEGYSALQAEILSQNPSYSISLFSPLGDAGAGHYASGEEYRLFTSNTCYEIETRIGASQFLNYPEGTIEEFSENNRYDLTIQMKAFINSITLRDGTRVAIPS